MALHSLVTGLYAFVTLQSTPHVSKSDAYCSVFSTQSPTKCPSSPTQFLDVTAQAPVSLGVDLEVLDDAFAALAVLQNEYFELGRNTWPSAIDWTAAVVQTVVSGMLTTLTASLDSVASSSTANWKAKENLISSFYDHVVSYYSGQDVLAIMDQAFDDMLWVVLGWIEAKNFVRLHEDLHFPESQHVKKGFPLHIKMALESLPWRGQSWVPSFDSRAQTFWNLGAEGWDTALCHGGMIWNPRLEPYKNAITNELYISASISMYQYLANASYRSNDTVYLQAAIEGYKWLINSNMTNDHGLFVDGFHINTKKHGNVECDVRNEMVYTYNQGVILTGQRELWMTSASISYLEDGHKLVQSVIKATGWNLRKNKPIDRLDNRHGRLPPWRGLGRGGILEEQCDASGSCSQDAQTFKGIYFHHLTTFCQSLDLSTVERDVDVDWQSFRRIKTAHAAACRAYLGWIRHNALAALRTRDTKGRFGMWWGAGMFGNIVVSQDRDGIDHAAVNATDYRNQGTPEDDVWGRNDSWLPGGGGGRLMNQDPLSSNSGKRDANDRGRGRTVETQAGGLALLHAYWEISTMSTTQSERVV